MPPGIRADGVVASPRRNSPLLKKAPKGLFSLSKARVSVFCVRMAFSLGAEHYAPRRAACALEYAFPPNGGSERSEQGGRGAR